MKSGIPLSKQPDPDVVDLRDVGASLVRGWRWIVGGLLVGVLVAAVALWQLPRRYQATTLVLIENTEKSPSLMGQLKEASRIAGGLSLPGAATGPELATEIAILTSRSVVAQLVDSLSLQAEVLSPAGAASSDLVELDLPGRFKPFKIELKRRGDTYRMEGPDGAVEVVPGRPVRLGGGTLTLKSGELPDRIRLRVRDREDAITQVEKRLDVDEVSADVIEVAFRARDRETAAVVPNELVERYLVRRQTLDRGINQKRLEFLEGQVDSLSRELVRAENLLRVHQEQSGMLDPELVGQAQVERTAKLQSELEAVKVDMQALQRILEARNAGILTDRQLAAYPTFLRTSAIGELLTRLIELETTRGQLLEMRMEADPQVVAVTRNIEMVERELASLSRSYLAGLTRQRAALETALAGFGAEASVLPAQAEQSYRLQREVRRLTETLMAVQAQLVDVRLAAVGEGGEVRRIDTAVGPRKPVFPRPAPVLAFGLLGGLVLGTVGALGAAHFGRRVERPADVELAAGVSALPYAPGMPLALGTRGTRRSALVIPVGSGAAATAVTRELAATALLQGERVVVADWSSAERRQGGASGQTGVQAPDASAAQLRPVTLHGAEYSLLAGDLDTTPTRARAAVEQLEQNFDVVLCSLPAFGHPLTTALLSPERSAVLVVRAHTTLREELRATVEALNQVGVPVAGVLFHAGVIKDAADA